MELTPEEQRVVGCLVEKELTTPEYYPLTLNALVTACNQTSNRNPVVSYDERTVQTALDSLRAASLTRIVHSRSNRASKHRHVLDEVLGLERSELALLGVLLLRGPQTGGELRTRSERMHPVESLAEVEATLDRLAERGLVRRLERQAGQKEARYVHLLGPAPESPPPAPPAPDRISALEEEVAALRAEVADLRERLADLL